MLSCYLVAKGTDPEAAINEIREKRPRSVETPRQERFVHEFAAYVKTKEASSTNVDESSPSNNS